MIVRNGHISTDIPIRKTKLVKKQNLIVRNGHISVLTTITNFWDRKVISLSAGLVKKISGITRTLISKVSGITKS